MFVYCETLNILRLKDAVEVYIAVLDAKSMACGRAYVDEIPLREDELDKIMRHAQWIPVRFYSDLCSVLQKINWRVLYIYMYIIL